MLSLLKQHHYDLSKFCVEIDDEVIVSDYFHPGGRADAITTLVVEVPTPERVTVDAAEQPEHSDEAKDVLTKLREGAWI